MKIPLILITIIFALSWTLHASSPEKIKLTIEYIDANKIPKTSSTITEVNKPFRIGWINKPVLYGIDFDAPHIMTSKTESHPITLKDLSQKVPVTIQNNQFNQVTPLIPNKLINTESGIIFDGEIQKSNGILKMNAKCISTRVDTVDAVYGEFSAPIHLNDKNNTLLNENKVSTASIAKEETYFTLFAEPGKKYEIKIRVSNEWIPVTIICDYEKAINPHDLTPRKQ